MVVICAGQGDDAVRSRAPECDADHPEATRAARGLAGDSTQAMSWFTVGGNVGIALGPAIVTPVLLATRLRGTPLLALAAVVVAAVLDVPVRGAGHAGPGFPAEPDRCGRRALPWAWPSRSAGLATPLFGLLADSGGLTTALAAIAAVPAIACALSFLVRDPARCAER